MKKTLMMAIMATMITAMLSGCGCEKESLKNTATNDEAATHVEMVTEVATDAQGNTYYTETTKYVSGDAETEKENKKAEEDTTSPTTAVKNDKTKASTSGNKQTSGAASKSNTTSNQTAVSSDNSSQRKTTNNSNNNTNTGNSTSNHSSVSNQDNTSDDPHAGKTWHEAEYKTVYHPAETKEVKVVDQEAYSYEEPVYDWRTFCNVCGADITENCSPHMKAHAIAREGGRYRDEYVQVGTRTVEVPEESHTETIVVKEAWSEKVLVKEAGWY